MKGIDAIRRLTDILYDLRVHEHHEHSRSRVYPQNISNTITLAADAAANTFGSWTQIVPINTIDFCFEAEALVVEAADAATHYLVQLGCSITDGDDPTTAQILGERRFYLPTPVGKSPEAFGFICPECAANSKLWGRIKTASVAADELEISVIVTRHIGIPNPIAQLTTWPWSA